MQVCLITISGTAIVIILGVLGIKHMCNYNYGSTHGSTHRYGCDSLVAEQGKKGMAMRPCGYRVTIRIHTYSLCAYCSVTQGFY